MNQKADKKDITIGVLGSTGRMGQAVLEALQASPPGQKGLAGTRFNLESVFGKSSVIIDFTSPEALPGHLDLAIHYKTPLVIGTTGLTPRHNELLSSAARTTGLVVSANMSPGIALLASFVQKASAMLDDSYDIEIAELHHRSKKDAPSGTSFMLGHAAARGRGECLQDIQADLVRAGTRKPGDIGFSVQRGGSVVGDHSVRFIGNEEMIEFSHRGLSRTLYAKGAIRAARWLINQQPGLYSLVDVLAG